MTRRHVFPTPRDCRSIHLISSEDLDELLTNRWHAKCKKIFGVLLIIAERDQCFQHRKTWKTFLNLILSLAKSFSLNIKASKYLSIFIFSY